MHKLNNDTHAHMHVYIRTAMSVGNLNAYTYTHTQEQRVLRTIANSPAYYLAKKIEEDYMVRIDG